jgi:L-ascorbate metabolism protein UlaG (beta-lactamase superfamily)
MMHRNKILLQWILGLLLGASSLHGLSAPTSPLRSSTQLFPQHFPAAKAQIPQQDLILTYLEINGFLMTTAGVTILIDPILEGPLDFGIPDIYTGVKKNLPSFSLCESLPPIDCILITQGLDDHAHVRTLTKLAADSNFDRVPIIAPPSARGALQTSGMLRRTVRFLRHGERTTIGSMDSTLEAGTIDIRATKGALVGPPWQIRENGYVLRPVASSSSSSSSSTSRRLAPSIYIEPHVEFDEKELKMEAPVDVVITPIVGQRLPILDLVYGPENAIKLVETLQPKIIIPMPNANINQSGIAASLVSENGSDMEFFKLLEKSKAKGTKVHELVPGRDETIVVY